VTISDDEWTAMRPQVMTPEERAARHREHTARYVKANPEKQAELMAKWREANPDYQREYRAKNIDRERANDRAWKRANRAKVNATFTRWAEKNREKLSQKAMAYQKANPDKAREIRRRRRARKANAPVVDLTAAVWRDILDEHNHCCYYCGAAGVRLEQEHKIPLVRGGSHTRANVVPSCGPCNRRKWTMTEEEFRERVRNRDGAG